MHFYYLDEAGCTGTDLGNKEQPIFVLGGISIRDEGWSSTQQAFHNVISGYFDGRVPGGFELHAEELLSPDGNGPFAGHDREKRNTLALQLLSLLEERNHDAHLFAIDKQKLARHRYSGTGLYDPKVPYLCAYDYMITYINWFVRKNLGPSARGMLIIDAKEQFIGDIERITHSRRFEGPQRYRIKRIVEFCYAVDSRKNPMIQLSDLIVFCAKKFLEIECGYRPLYPVEARRFFAECYLLIHERIRRKSLVENEGRGAEELNAFLKEIQARPQASWRRRFRL